MWKAKKYAFVIWILGALVLLNILHALFLYQIEYEPIRITTSIESDFDTWVWYSSKPKASDSVVLHERIRLKKGIPIEVPIKLDYPLGADYVSLNWNYANQGVLVVSALSFGSKNKRENSTFPSRFVTYTSDNVTASNNALAQLEFRSNILANGWAMFNQGELDKLAKKKRFSPFSIGVNLILLVLLLWLFKLKKWNEKTLLFLRLNAQPLAVRLRFWVLCIWWLLLPFWVISSHILMAVSVALMLWHFYVQREVLNKNELVKFVPLVALYMGIIIINSLGSHGNLSQDIADYSYFFFMPLALIGLPKNVVLKLVKLFPWVIFLYMGLLLLSSVERFFFYDGALSFKKVFVETIELYWHSSYLAAFAVLGLLLFLLKKHKLWQRLIVIVFVPCFIIYSEARLLFLLGVLLSFWMLVKHLEKTLKKWAMVSLGLACFTLVVALATNKTAQEFAKETLLTNDSQSSDARPSLWRAAKFVYQDRPWTGVGRDNVRTQLANYIDDAQTIKYRRYNAHNQYLEFLLAYGHVVLLLFVLVLLTPLLVSRGNMSMVFMVLFSLAIVVESYLARQAGVIFFTLWYSFFLLYDRVLLAKSSKP